MAILCVKLKPITRPTNLNGPCPNWEKDEESFILFNMLQRLYNRQSPEVAGFTMPETRNLNEQEHYYVFGIVPTGVDVKIQTLLDIGRTAASYDGVQAAIAFVHPDQIRSSDLKDMGGFAAIMDMVDAETEEFEKVH